MGKSTPYYSANYKDSDWNYPTPNSLGSNILKVVCQVMKNKEIAKTKETTMAPDIDGSQEAEAVPAKAIKRTPEIILSSTIIFLSRGAMRAPRRAPPLAHAKTAPKCQTGAPGVPRTS